MRNMALLPFSAQRRRSGLSKVMTATPPPRMGNADGSGEKKPGDLKPAERVGDEISPSVQHLQHVRLVLGRFQDIGRSVSPKRSFVACPSVWLMGFWVDGLGMCTPTDRCAA